ncbi:MAG: hypothetical protein IPK81_00165 [Rhodospirillales bacterium]|nr:MAG: hypothetical protein IPK81_00165 [Rhodospirillales bacterium]
MAARGRRSRETAEDHVLRRATRVVRVGRPANDNVWAGARYLRLAAPVAIIIAVVAAGLVFGR